MPLSYRGVFFTSRQAHRYGQNSMPLASQNMFCISEFDDFKIHFCCCSMKIHPYVLSQNPSWYMPTYYWVSLCKFVDSKLSLPCNHKSMHPPEVNSTSSNAVESHTSRTITATWKTRKRQFGWLQRSWWWGFLFFVFFRKWVRCLWLGRLSFAA